jgi:hypothetical protein
VTRALAASPHLAHDDQPARAKAKNGTTPNFFMTSTTIAACKGEPDAVMSSAPSPITTPPLDG